MDYSPKKLAPCDHDECGLTRCRHTTPFEPRHCQRIRAVNEFGETFEGTVQVIQPVALNEWKKRLTIRKDNGHYFNCYTNDPDYWTLTLLVEAPALPEKQECPAPVPALRRGVQNDCLGLSWEQIERMQGGGKITR